MRRHWVVTALLVVTVALGIGTNVADDRLLPYGPTSVTGSLGEDIDVYPYRLHVSEVRAAESVVEQRLFGESSTIDTDGVWVVVTVSYATQDRVRIPISNGIVLRDAEGRRYPASTRGPGTAWLAGADIWIRGDLAFEVAPDSLGTLTLEFAPEQRGQPLPMAYAVIELEVTPDDVEPQLELGEQVVLGEGER